MKKPYTSPIDKLTDHLKFSILSWMILAEYIYINALRYHEEALYFPNWQVQGIFSEDFHAFIAAVETVILHWIYDCSF